MLQSWIIQSLHLKLFQMNYLSNLSPMNGVKKFFSRQEKKPNVIRDQKDQEESTTSQNLKQRKTQNYYEEKIRETVRFRQSFLNPMMSISYYPQALLLETAFAQYLYEESGAKILDCINNVSHVGHRHPYYVLRMQTQINVLLTNSRFLYDELKIATEKLLKKFPPELCCVTWANSGSEANDIAMQLAACHTKKRGVICLDGAYHGITKACMDVSPYKWNQNYVRSKDVIVADSPCTYRGFLADSQDPAGKFIEHLQGLIGEDSGAFICELMQSCAGQIIPPKEFFKKIQTFLKSKGIVFIADEVQTGFGRIGSHFWAFEYYQITPDIVTVGKAMGNGFPVSAVICTREIADSFKKRGIQYFSTFGANPLAATAVSSVLDIIQYQKLRENAHQTGIYMKEKFDLLKQSYQFIGDVRGLGLFQGLDIVKDRKSKQQDQQMAKAIIMSMRKKGIIVSRDGPKHNILKIKPPMVFNKSNVDELIKGFIETFEELK